VELDTGREIMSKYKVGDKVRIRGDLIPHKMYGELYLTDEMKPYIGREAVIAVAYDIGYKLEGIPTRYWTDQMLEERSEVMKYKIGDKVKIRKDLREGMGNPCATVVEEMLQYRGKTMTVRSVLHNAYCMEEDANTWGGWSWTDEMFEERSENMIPYETNYLYKQRGNGLSVILTNDYGEPAFFSRKSLVDDGYGAYDGYVQDRDQFGKDKGESQYDIVAYKEYDNQGDAVAVLIKGTEPVWDWEETKETVMTVAEIEKKLGIKNLRIKKED
jgi:ribosomal protein L21E